MIIGCLTKQVRPEHVVVNLDLRRNHRILKDTTFFDIDVSESTLLRCHCVVHVASFHDEIVIF